MYKIKLKEEKESWSGKTQTKVDMTDEELKYLELNQLKYLLSIGLRGDEYRRVMKVYGQKKLEKMEAKKYAPLR